MERKAAAPSPAASKGHRSNIRRPSRPDPPRSPTPPPLETRRSLRPRTATLYVAADYASPSSEEERERERERRKVKFVKLHRSPAARKPAPDPSSDSDSASSTSFSSYGEDDAVKPPKKRRINGRDDGGGSDGSGQLEQLKKQSVPKSKIGFLGKSPDAAKTAKATRLPERNVLEEVLDKLQKKDTYGVYGQPVDLEELPDYYDVIEHPMDFGTVRKKLAKSVYRTFEQFEDDVFLICSNAMQYNAPHTVYFRQARAIEEMARKNFQILRADAKLIETARKSEEKIKFSPTEEKQLKKATYKTEKEPLGSDISSSGTHTSAGDTCTGSNVDRSNDLKVRRANVCEKPANSITSITPRVNTVKKAASSNGLDMLSDNAVEKPASANGVRKAHTSSVQRLATSNGLSAVQAKSAEKPLAANVLSLGMENANAIETIASANKLSTPQANVVEKPATANGLSTAQTDTGKEARNAHGLSLLHANSIEKRSTSTSSGLSVIAANTAEKPATSIGLGTAQADAGQEARNCHGLSSTRANSTEKHATSTGLSTIAANPVERPVTSNGSGKAQTNAIEQPTIIKGFAECSSPADESRSDMVDEFSAKYSPSKVGRKPIMVDENRRLTYNHSEQQEAVESDSVLHIFDSEMKQLVDVGFHSENSYALSLARFAAYLGPVGWEIASEKIQKVIPSDVKFGRGWVGEYEPLSTPVLSLEKHTQPLGYGSITQKMGPKMDKEVGVKSKTTKKGNYEAMQFGIQSQVNIGMTHHTQEIISSELKQGIIGTSAETQPGMSNPVLQQEPKISNPVLQQAETQPKISNPVVQQAETPSKICNPVRQQAVQAVIQSKVSNPVRQAEIQSKVSNPVRQAVQTETQQKFSNPVRQQAVQAETQPKIGNPLQQAETQQKFSNPVRQEAETQPKISNPVQQAETQPKFSNPVRQAETQQNFSNPVRQQAEIQPKISNPVQQAETQQKFSNPVRQLAEIQPKISNPVQQAETQPKISNPVQQAETQQKFSNPVRQLAEIQPKISNPVQQAETQQKISNPVRQAVQAETQPKISNPVQQAVQAETLQKFSSPVRQQAETQPKISNPVRQAVQAETQQKFSNPVRQQAETQQKIRNPVRQAVQAETQQKFSNPVRQQAETQQKFSNRVQQQAVQAESQPKISNPVFQQQKGHVAGDSSACKEKSEQIGLCNSSSISSISVEKSLQRPNLHSEAHRQRSQGVSADVQSRVTNVVAQQRNREVDFTKISNNASEQAGVSNSSSINSIPIETPFQRREYYPQAQKLGMFGVSSVPQPRISGTMLRQQKDRSDNDISKTCIGASHCNLTSISNIPAETVLQRDQYHKQGLFGVSAETQRRISDTMQHQKDEAASNFMKDTMQHQKDQAASNFMKAYQNAPELIRSQSLYSVGNIPVEKDVQKTMFHSESATNSWSQEFIARNRNQLPLEQQEALGLTVGGLGNHQISGSSGHNRSITSLDFVTNRQSGVAGYSLPNGSCEQAVDFRLMDLSGKMSNQPSYLNANIYNANQVRSSIPPPIRDDSSTAAARTWMSFRSSAERRPVDATGVVHTQMGSAPSLNSTWKTPASAVRVHGDSMMRSSNVLPHPIPFGNEESQNQSRGLVFFPQVGATDLSRFHGRPPWQGLSPHSQPKQMDTHPPDLNIGFQPSGSPVRLSSGIIVDSQQPDLALQL